jgi:hypothetical protein
VICHAGPMRIGPDVIGDVMWSGEYRIIRGRNRDTDQAGLPICCNLTSKNFAAIQMAKSSLKKEQAREKKDMEAAKNDQIEKWFTQEEEAMS